MSLLCSGSEAAAGAFARRKPALPESPASGRSPLKLLSRRRRPGPRSRRATRCRDVSSRKAPLSTATLWGRRAPPGEAPLQMRKQAEGLGAGLQPARVSSANLGVSTLT